MFNSDSEKMVPNPEDGLYHVHAEYWDPPAMEQLLCLAHVQMKYLYIYISPNRSVDVCVMTEYHQMNDMMDWMPQVWFKGLEDMWMETHGDIYGEELIGMMFLATCECFPPTDVFKHQKGYSRAV